MTKSELDSLKFCANYASSALNAINEFADSSDYSGLRPNSYSLIFSVQDKLGDIIEELQGLLEE